MPLNIEIKAKASAPEKIRQILIDKNADFIGMDHQIDTYFDVPNGRMKLREGNIENNLIFYNRSDQSGPKKSEVILYKSTPESTLDLLLEKAIGVKVIVDKEREIYFIENVKFHIDKVKQLGNFVEIEAIDKDGSIPESKLLEQCEFYKTLFGIKDDDLITNSYSDLLLTVVE